MSNVYEVTKNTECWKDTVYIMVCSAELMKSRVLELNASDERGIAVVRERVKQFAQLTAAPTPRAE